MDNLKSTSGILDLIEDAIQDRLNAHGISVISETITEGQDEITLIDENEQEIARYKIKIEKI